MIDSSSNSTYGVSIAELKVPAGEKSSPRAHSTDKIYRWCTAEQIMVCSYVRIIARNFAQSQEHLFSRTPLFVVPSLSQPLRPLTHSPQGNLPTSSPGRTSCIITFTLPSSLAFYGPLKALLILRASMYLLFRMTLLAKLSTFSPMVCDSHISQLSN